MPRLLILTALFCLVAGPLLAQTSTGRHRQSTASEPEPAAEYGDEDSGKWFFMPGAGIMTSGDLARFRTINGGDQTWQPPGGQPFNSADFVLTLDESIALAVTVGRRVGSRFAVRLDFSAAELPMAAIARVGEEAGVFRWDELAVMMLGLSAEYRISATPSYFYLLAGGTATRVSGGLSDAYNQTQPGLRFGAGYHQHLGGDWGLRGELRDTLQSLDFADYHPPVPEGAPDPDAQVEELGPQHMVEILFVLHGSF